MVGPGEVDPELEAETTEECMKYGKVNKCVIYEVRNKRSKAIGWYYLVHFLFDINLTVKRNF